MTQPKLKQLSKLLLELRQEVHDGTFWQGNSSSTKSEDAEPFAAEMIGLVQRWVHRMLD